MARISDTMSYADFLELKHLLGISKYDLKELCSKIKDILIKSFPPTA